MPGPTGTLPGRKDATQGSSIRNSAANIFASYSMKEVLSNNSKSWKAYFSIFYMRNGEMYKECENPNCKRDKFFLVEATRTNKHYCCEQCRNAAGAQRYRNRKL